MHIGFIYTNFNVTVSQPRPGVGQVKHELNGTRNDDMSIDVGKDINDIKDTVADGTDCICISEEKSE